MISISIKDFVNKSAEANPGTNIAELTESCKSVLNDKRTGAVCQLCGGEIWAAGAAVTGTYLCFSCMTGESDDSEDYEIMQN